MNAFEFSEEWKNIEKYLRTFIGAMIFSIPERADILQNAAFVMWRKIDSFDPARASFKTWAAGVVHMECLAYMHSCKSEKLLFDSELIDRAANIVFQEETEPAYRKLDECMNSLSADKLELLKMKYNERLSVSEISKRLDVTEAAVKEKLYRIRKDLKSLLIKSKKSGD